MNEMFNEPRYYAPFDGSNKSKTSPSAPSKFCLTSTTEIMATEYPEIMWVVPGYLPEGFSVLAGRQKLGKTFLALDFAIAVSTGGYAVGTIECDTGDVLFIDMENGERRIKRRIESIFPDVDNRPDMGSLKWAGEVIALDKGFIDAIDEWRRSVPSPRMIVIDVLQRIKPAGNRNRNAYENDYAIFSELQAWATEHGVGVLALHHTRKGGADDPLEALSGSNGLAACADSILVLDRDSDGITLYVRGRDVGEKEMALKFDGANWIMLGNASEIRRSEERAKIIVALEEAGEPLSPKHIADVTGLKSANVRQLLGKMTKAGDIERKGRGNYVSVSKCAPLTPDHIDNNDHNLTI